MDAKKALVIMQVASEGPGTIERAMRGSGIEPEFVRVYAGEEVPLNSAPYAAIVVLGGPMGVYEEERYPFIKREIALIKDALKEGVPVLGVCLGAQLLAAAAGARVYSGGKKEIGWHKVRLTEAGKLDPLFSGLPSEFTPFHWHGDTFDLPEGAVLLASSELFPNQLFRINKKSYGFQFHIEISADMVADFIYANSEEPFELGDLVDTVAITGETPEMVGPLERFSGMVFTRFFKEH